MIYGDVTDPWAGEVGAASATANQEASDVPADDEVQLVLPTSAPLACGWRFIDSPSSHGNGSATHSSFAILPSASSHIAIDDSSSRKMDFYRSKSGRAAAVRTAKWTLLNTVLTVSASVVLYGLAVFAYLLFYHNYLPDQESSVPIHLQYGGHHEIPYGLASVREWNLKEAQDYDVTVSLTIPRSPANIDRGNFMVVLHLLDRAGTAPVTTEGGQSDSQTPPFFSLANPPPEQSSRAADRHILFTSSRAALIPYTDPLVSLASRVLFILYHILWPHSERARLDVPMAERIAFSTSPAAAAAAADGACARACPLPSLVYVELRAGSSYPVTVAPLQVYSATVSLTARLSGLRWFMLRHRYVAFAVLTTAFWLCEVVAAAVAWAVLASYTATSKPGFSAITTPGSPSSESEDSEGQEGRKGKGRAKAARRGKPGDGYKPESSMTPASRIKSDESDDESDGSAPVSDNDHVWDVKKEEGTGDDSDSKGLIGLAGLPVMTPAIGVKGEDESEEELGIGTSRDAGLGTASVRRRRSRGRD